MELWFFAVLGLLAGALSYAAYQRLSRRRPALPDAEAAGEDNNEDERQPLARENRDEQQADHHVVRAHELLPTDPAAAVLSFQAAQEVFTREAYPAEWADQQRYVGIALARMGRAEEAEAALLEALEVVPRLQDDEEWATTTVQLASVLLLQGAEQHARAAELLRQTLDVFSDAEHPQERALSLTLLAEAEAESDPDAAADHLRRALAAYDREAQPSQWAQAHSKLAQLLDDQGLFDEALGHYELALQVWTRQAEPAAWAAAHHAMGDLHRERFEQTGHAADVDDALQHYHAVLRVVTREAHPEDWAAAQVGIANALRDQVELARDGAGDDADADEASLAEDLEQAISRYSQALEVFPGDGQQACDTHLQLAVALSMRSFEGRHPDALLSHLRRAQAIAEEGHFLSQLFSAHYVLGCELQERGARDEAAAHLEQAVTAAGEDRGRAASAHVQLASSVSGDAVRRHAEAAMRLVTEEEAPMVWERARELLG